VCLVYIGKVLGSNPDHRFCFLRFVLCLRHFLQGSLEQKLKLITVIFFHFSDWPQTAGSLISSYFYSVEWEETYLNFVCSVRKLLAQIKYVASPTKLYACGPQIWINFIPPLTCWVRRMESMKFHSVSYTGIFFMNCLKFTLGRGTNVIVVKLLMHLRFSGTVCCPSRTIAVRLYWSCLC